MWRNLVFVSLTLCGPASAFASWKVDRVQGEATIENKANKKLATPLVAGVALKSGDQLATGAKGRIHLKDGESEIWIGSSARVGLHHLLASNEEGEGRIDVLAGKLRARFKRPSSPEDFPYKVRAKSVVAGVRGTEFMVSVEGSEEKVCTFEGLVRVTSLHSKSELWDVPAGKGLVVKPNEMPKVRESSSEQVEAWKKATDS